MIEKLKTRRAAVAVIVCVATLVFFSCTNPGNLPAVAFIAAFGLLFSGLWLIVQTGLLVSRYKSDNKRQRQLIALAASGVITVLLGLSSIGQLSWHDILTLGVFFGLLYFYGSRFLRRS